MTAGLAITEADWQQQVIDLAHLYNWRHLHVRRSIGKGRSWQTTTNVIGWPDLVLWHESQRRVIAAELKSDTGKATPEQIEVLRSLEAAGLETHIWRPSDLERVASTLKGKT